MTAWELVNRIHAMLGERHKDATYEGIITPSAPDAYGAAEGVRPANVSKVVTGVLVANEPSVDAIRLAIATGRNCIVCREHPYYLFGEAWSGGLENRLAADPVVDAKRKLIEQNQLVIIRLASLWDSARPKWFSSALARTLGWHPENTDSADQWNIVYCKVPTTTLLTLAEGVSQRLNAGTLRMTGEPTIRVSRVGVIHGLAFPTLVLAHALRDTHVDALVVGSTPEVDFCTTYVRDAIAAGRRVGMVQVGYEKSTYPGAVEVAQWLRGILPGMPVDLQPAPAELCWLG